MKYADIRSDADGLGAQIEASAPRSGQCGAASITR